MTAMPVASRLKKASSHPALAGRIARACETAAAFADAVDAEARFPTEAFEVIRREKLLSIMIPTELGGEGMGFSEVMEITYALGSACASTALIFAMHHVKAACIVRHLHDSVWHRDFLRRAAAHEWLFASSTTEGQNGGNVRSSAAPVEVDGDCILLNRDATVLSYGLQGDALVTTARREAGAAGSDQVLLILERADYTLEATNTWNTLGMRGTASVGFSLRARALPEQVMPEAYASIHAASMVPAAHLMWSAAWAGIAAGAVEKARLYTRKAARANGGQMPPGAAWFAKATGELRKLRALLRAGLLRFEALEHDHEALMQADFQTEISLLKVDASELAVSCVTAALRSTGLAGYRNDSEVSIGRALRDILSAPIMINNERILANLQSASLLAPTPLSFRD
jgi:acyl-CoA dehydrogenase